MTSPTGGGSEHIARYRALGEFDNLVRAAKEAKKALRELREEEAKLNAQSLADDKKIAASKQTRARAEQENIAAAKKSAEELNRSNAVGKAGEDAGVSYSRGMGRGIQKETQSGQNRQFLDAATKALQQAFANAGEKSGITFVANTKRRIEQDSTTISKSPAFHRALREMRDQAGQAGLDTGNRYVQGFASKIRDLNNILSVLGMDKLDLDVGLEDARQSIKALEFELTRLSHTTAEPQIIIDSNRALSNLRAIQKLFRDEVAEDIVKESQRIRKELEKIDSLPSGKSFRFWALTAMADMARVFEEAERGTSVFTRLRLAAAGGGGGGNFLRSFISGFDDFSESSSKLLQRLSRISGELYRMPGIIAVLVASLPALVAGIGALGGGALGLSSGLGAALGVVAAFPGAVVALGTSVAALGGTFSGFSEILKNAKQAHQEELEAQEQARLGTDKALTAQQKYNAALRDMDPATQAVTEAIVAFSEKWATAQQRIGENFFKEIAGDTENLNDLLPILEDLLGQAAGALGRVASSGLEMLTSGPWKADFKIIAKDNAESIENMGFAGLSLVEAFKDIVIAAGPFNSWLTKAIREGADAFSDWASNARSNGTIADFLDETKESLQVLWQIFKNLGNVVNSFFQSTVDEGQNYLRTLERITSGWADVAKAQEEANSPLRQWMIQIRPILSGLGALIRDLGRGIADLATNQNNITTMVDLLDSLRTDVLPPILRILQQLNDSGIAVTVVKALGGLLDAIATFLESGATQALTVFVTVLANFAQLLFDIATLPGISDVLGAVASGIAAIAAVSIVARFTGLFKLWDFFTWMTRNKGNLSGAFTDAARGVAGLQGTGQTPLPANIPSTIGPIGSEVGNSARAIENVGTAAQNANGKVSVFSRTMSGLNAAGNLAKGAMGGFLAAIGGPWTLAIAGAVAGLGLLASKMSDQKKDAEDTRGAFLALKDAYGELRGGNTDTVNSLADTNEKFREVIQQADLYNVSITDVSGALNNQEQSVARFNSQMDAQIAALTAARDEQIAYAKSQGDTTGAFNEGIAAVQEQIDTAQKYKDQVNEVAEAQTAQNEILRDGASVTRTYEERLGGLTQEQVDNAVAVGEMESQIRLLSGALDTLASATATNSDKSKAMADLIEHETGAMVDANEAAENWNSTLLTLTETAEANGKSLGKKTREGLRNRDALEAAAKATRDLYLEDIASGVPMDEALKRHQDRIKELEKEADKTFKNKKEVQKLIDTYGEVPDNLKTNILTDEKGFAAVYAELMQLSVMQKALSEGKSLKEAQQDWNRESGRLYERYIPGRGDGYGVEPKFSTGGPVWGAGTRTSDSIRAWLSNGEFVQPTDAVEHYGIPIMEALRTRKLDKADIEEALPDNDRTTFSSGGQAHSDNCMSCQSGGHKFASGGSVRIPMVVDPSNTKIDKDWVYAGMGGLGGASGPGGWRWQMSVLRKAFPGLPLWSGYRPGSTTLSGNRSYHSLGRAVDLPPRRDVATWIRANYGARTRELITPFNDLNLHNGRPHRYTGAVWNQHNFAGGNAHNHWAYNQGGLVDIMNALNMSNITPQQSAPLPTTPRTLSPAASSVVNNTNENGTTFGDVIINNPLPERGGDSIRNVLYRTQYLLG